MDMQTNTVGSSAETIVDVGTASSPKDTVPIPEITMENSINRNKPWRVVIRRQVADGGSDNQSISRTIRNDQSV